MPCKVEVLHQSPRWKKALKNTALVSQAVTAALKQLKVKKSAVLCVLLTDDAQMRELNRDFRGKDKATNVLSFPGYEGKFAGGELGDIALGLETIQSEAKAQGKTFEHHVTHLLVHGTLHLLGFDHEARRDAARMELIEIQVLKTLGIANPYMI